MIKEARTELETIKRDYKKYSLENQVHFRVHNALRRVKELEQGGGELQDEEPDMEIE
jgi:hypothetical protein